MQITCTNFGAFADYSATLQTMTAPNGTGKTTTLNAYYFAITGRTLNGFEARRIGAPEDEPTAVTLDGFCGLPSIRRTLAPTGGTALYIGGDYCTQTEFIQVCAERGIDITFAATCADANALTNNALTSEDLRTLLVRADVMDGDDAAKLRKEAADVRKKRKTAEQYALSNIAIPVRTVEPLNEAEIKYMSDFETYQVIERRNNPRACEFCKRDYDEVVWRENEKTYRDACDYVINHADEYKRLAKQVADYNAETQKIADAQRLIANATQARADVNKYDARLQKIDQELRELDANAVRAELPEGVELITEQTSKMGNVKSVCTLTWNGIPLKSVNHAKRIEICVHILDQARAVKGMDAVPIIVDNAEAIQGLDNIHNVIKLNVGI